MVCHGAIVVVVLDTLVEVVVVVLVVVVTMPLPTTRRTGTRSNQCGAVVIGAEMRSTM